MWTREHTIHAEADPALVWQRWSDPSLWPEDEPDVLAAQLDAPVAVGVTGTLQMTRGPESRITVVLAEQPTRLHFETPLPGAVLRIEQEQEVADGRTSRLTHRVRFTGPAARVWRSLIGNGIADAMPAVMRNVIDHSQPPAAEESQDAQSASKESRQGGAGRTRAPRTPKGIPMPVTVNMDSLLDKAYENSSLAEILAAPVDALAGVSASDAEALKSAFNIKTVADLGKNKYFAAAVTLHELSEAGAK